MLKIRDDVDLKELEKFGFNYIENKDYKSYEKGRLFDQFMCVDVDERILKI